MRKAPSLLFLLMYFFFLIGAFLLGGSGSKDYLVPLLLAFLNLLGMRFFPKKFDETIFLDRTAIRKTGWILIPISIFSFFTSGIATYFFLVAVNRTILPQPPEDALLRVYMSNGPAVLAALLNSFLATTFLAPLLARLFVSSGEIRNFETWLEGKAKFNCRPPAIAMMILVTVGATLTTYFATKIHTTFRKDGISSVSFGSTVEKFRNYSELTKIINPDPQYRWQSLKLCFGKKSFYFEGDDLPKVQAILTHIQSRASRAVNISSNRETCTD